MSRMNIRTLFALSCIGLLPLLLSSCVTTVTDSTPVLQEAADFPEQALPAKQLPSVCYASE